MHTTNAESGRSTPDNSLSAGGAGGPSTAVRTVRSSHGHFTGTGASQRRNDERYPLDLGARLVFSLAVCAKIEGTTIGTEYGRRHNVYFLPSLILAHGNWHRIAWRRCGIVTAWSMDDSTSLQVVYFEFYFALSRQDRGTLMRPAHVLPLVPSFALAGVVFLVIPKYLAPTCPLRFKRAGLFNQFELASTTTNVSNQAHVLLAYPNNPNLPQSCRRGNQLLNSRRMTANCSL